MRVLYKLARIVARDGHAAAVLGVAHAAVRVRLPACVRVPCQLTAAVQSRLTHPRSAVGRRTTARSGARRAGGGALSFVSPVSLAPAAHTPKSPCKRAARSACRRSSQSRDTHTHAARRDCGARTSIPSPGAWRELALRWPIERHERSHAYDRTAAKASEPGDAHSHPPRAPTPGRAGPSEAGGAWASSSSGHALAS